MNIRYKVTLPVVCAMTLILTCSIFSIVRLELLIHQYQELFQQDIHRLNHIASLESEFKSQVQAWKNVLIRNEEKYWQQFETHHSTIQKNIKNSLNQLTQVDAEYISLLTQVKNKHNALLPKYLTAYQAFNATQSIVNTDKMVRGIDRDMANFLKETRVDVQTASNQHLAAINAQQTLVMTVYPIIALIISLVVIVVMLQLLKRTIILPLRALIANTVLIAQGKYDLPMSYPYQDELGDLSNAIVDIKTHIVEAVSNITVVKGEVEEAFSEIDNVSEQITQGSNDQERCSADMEKTIAGLADIAEQLQQHSQMALNSTNTVTNQATQCTDIVDNSANSMKILVTEVEKTSAVIQDLEQQAGSVSSVLDVISSIAEQTNLLALNAAIEAARAGEAGRGFAVVADEVRSLASKTQQSTLSITSVINNLQSAAQNAVSAMQEEISITTKNAEQTTLAQQSLKEIMQEMVQMTQLNNQVAHAAEQQSNITESLQQTLLQLQSISNNYKALAQSDKVSKTVANANHDLNVMVEKLRGNLSHQEVELF
ncbi:methyl-accepting chemotaxis protein [Pseudoalteromonas citrea]|uniref:Methyl-accepting chemotaxis protein n=1 Tax=Pseudoalteromonas citrea TaxID=43655 RepID=A0A5S3XRP2_9GAMM|nr:methyl-accepting chemotaxis protein [Pseudoalteromonas citrea]TMP39813.1 methyl-accepting chemotaxis protein [Pseudoalteromonas citrea]TMP60520.1 methyl-accepting chemotaxis protein [Pseudoalteromonas citrea]